MATTLAEGAGILNQTLQTLGYGDYQIDTTDNTTITNGFNAIAVLAPETISQILNQTVVILTYRNYGLMFDQSKNPIRTFLRNDVEFGGGIEDIYHEIISPIEGIWAEDVHTGAKTAAQVAAQLCDFYQSDLKKKFHTSIDDLDIPMSVTEYELKRAFTPAGYASFIDVKMANMQRSAEYQLLLWGIDSVKQQIADQKIIFKKGNNVNTINGVTTLVESVRTTTDGMQTPNSVLNYSSVVNISDESDLFLFVTPELMNRLQTRGFANAFNVDYYRNKNRLVMLPYGTSLGTDDDGNPVLCALFDRRAIVMSIKYWQVRPFIVANTDYTNYFLKAKLLHGYNEFYPAVAFSGTALGDFDASVDVNGQGVLV